MVSPMSQRHHRAQPDEAMAEPVEAMTDKQEVTDGWPPFDVDFALTIRYGSCELYHVEKD
jgi:hypothetical protein